MIVTVRSGPLSGSVNAPVSKSAMQRACAIALLAKGTSVLQNPGISNDDQAALDVIQRLGAKVIRLDDGSLQISSEGVHPVSSTLNCGESGLGIRMFTPLAALSTDSLTITGSGSLLTRPMNFFDEIFPLLGISIQSSGGRLPLQIKGPLRPASITVDGSLSSQFLTGLLLAYAASVDAHRHPITVTNLRSKPYIDLTLELLQHAGISIVHEDYKVFHFPENSGELKPLNYSVEGDWSGAAFLLVAGALYGNISVSGLNASSAQADKAILDALSLAGAAWSEKDGVFLTRHAPLNAFEFDATDCPDLFPPLVALAARCNGTSTLAGVNRLAHKESNRGLALQQEFGKMGVEIVLNDNLMQVKGTNHIKGAELSSHHDHRIAMAGAIAGIGAEGITRITDAGAIDKSYPEFYRDMQSLNAIIEIEP